MLENKKGNISRNVFGLLLIVIGGLFLLSSLNVIDLRVGRIVFSSPMVLIIIGLFILINSQRKLFGSIVLGLGILLMLPRIIPGISISREVIFSIVITAIGAYILLKQRTKTEDRTYNARGTIKKDVIDDVAIFGGGNKIIYSDQFKGGNITAIFGGSEIDLTQCKLAEGENIIDVLCIFGATEIVIPKDWTVHINITPIFGGFSNKTRRDLNLPADTEKSLVIKGAVIFGGGEIKSFY